MRRIFPKAFDILGPLFSQKWSQKFAAEDIATIKYCRWHQNQEFLQETFRMLANHLSSLHEIFRKINQAVQLEQVRHGASLTSECNPMLDE